jgi:hypothetical protein
VLTIQWPAGILFLSLVHVSVAHNGGSSVSIQKVALSVVWFDDSGRKVYRMVDKGRGK